MSRYVSAVRQFVARVAGREEGASLAEYGLLLALIAVACIAAITLLGSSISALFSSLAGSI